MRSGTQAKMSRRFDCAGFDRMEIRNAATPGGVESRCRIMARPCGTCEPRPFPTTPQNGRLRNHPRKKKSRSHIGARGGLGGHSILLDGSAERASLAPRSTKSCAPPNPATKNGARQVPTINSR